MSAVGWLTNYTRCSATAAILGSFFTGRMAQTKTVRATDKVAFVNDEAELKERGYAVGMRLGEGSYAKVFSAYSEKLGKKVAVKIINQKKGAERFSPKVSA